MTDDRDLVLDPREAEPPIEPTVSPVQFNAVKHGILSVSPVIPHFEDEQDWYDFRDSVFESMQPEGGLQYALTDRVASLLWRLMRVVRYEREVVSSSIESVSRDMETTDVLLGARETEFTARRKERMDRMAMSRLVPDDQVLSKILRYEGRLHRQLLQTIHQLRLLQGLPTHVVKGRLGIPDPGVPAARLSDQRRHN